MLYNDPLPKTTRSNSRPVKYWQAPHSSSFGSARYLHWIVYGHDYEWVFGLKTGIKLYIYNSVHYTWIEYIFNDS
jgi:hypothetical protein